MQAQRVFQLLLSIGLVFPCAAHAGSPLRKAAALLKADVLSRPAAKQSTITRTPAYEIWDSGGHLASVSNSYPGAKFRVVTRVFQVRIKDQGVLRNLASPRLLSTEVNVDGRGRRRTVYAPLALDVNGSAPVSEAR